MEVALTLEQRRRVARAIHAVGRAQAELQAALAARDILLHDLKADLGLEAEAADFDTRRLVFIVGDGPPGANQPQEVP